MVHVQRQAKLFGMLQEWVFLGGKVLIDPKVFVLAHKCLFKVCSTQQDLSFEPSLNFLLQNNFFHIAVTFDPLGGGFPDSNFEKNLGASYLGHRSTMIKIRRMKSKILFFLEHPPPCSGAPAWVLLLSTFNICIFFFALQCR